MSDQDCVTCRLKLISEFTGAGVRLSGAKTSGPKLWLFHVPFSNAKPPPARCTSKKHPKSIAELSIHSLGRQRLEPQRKESCSIAYKCARQRLFGVEVDRPFLRKAELVVDSVRRQPPVGFVGYNRDFGSGLYIDPVQLNAALKAVAHGNYGAAKTVSLAELPGGEASVTAESTCRRIAWIGKARGRTSAAGGGFGGPPRMICIKSFVTSFRPFAPVQPRNCAPR
jgi:hypothetical protein